VSFNVRVATLEVFDLFFDVFAELIRHRACSKVNNFQPRRRPSKPKLWNIHHGRVSVRLFLHHGDRLYRFYGGDEPPDPTG
jgi:hypothetical protein